MSYTYDYYPAHDLILSYCLGGLLTPVFDDVEGKDAWKVRGQQRANTELIEGGDKIGSETEEKQATLATLSMASLIGEGRAFIHTLPTYCVVNPVIVRMILESRSTLLHLGILAHLLWLDKQAPLQQQWFIMLVNENEKTSELNFDKLRHGIELARAKGVPRKLRSRPDIGLRYKQRYKTGRGVTPF